MENEQPKILAKYDVRGIQNYVFRTPKLKHAIGGSAIVADIIDKALAKAVKALNYTHALEWEEKDYEELDVDVQVLYIGGGNSYVIFRNKDIYMNVTRKMSKYVLEETYSLQLAATFVEKTLNYKKDFANLNKKMTKVKANMQESNPIGALPVMKVELATGLPANSSDKSLETIQKENAEKNKRSDIVKGKKIFDNYIEEKGDDSTLAVVHMDGNNMGLRINNLVSNAETYTEAVNLMRKISYNISTSYTECFNEMAEKFNSIDEYIVLPVLTAGDDITYVCNGSVAIASVECFVKLIREKSMIEDPQNTGEYNFSICGGIAYFRSHFPFNIAYKVAEACCETAKDRAKENAEKEKTAIGNYFDFQFCKNIQSTDLETIRKTEYIAATGENLLTRPFEIGGSENKEFCYGKLKKYLEYFIKTTDKNELGEKETKDSGKLPRSHAKKIRNLYPLGERKINEFGSFLQSRNWTLPEDDMNFYVQSDKGKIAKYYDALELMDVYVSLEAIEEKLKNE